MPHTIEVVLLAEITMTNDIRKHYSREMECDFMYVCTGTHADQLIMTHTNALVNKPNHQSIHK